MMWQKMETMCYAIKMDNACSTLHQTTAVVFQKQCLEREAAGNDFRELHYHIHHEHWRFQAHQRIHLLKDDNHTDTAHKARQHWIRNISHQLAYLDYTEYHLEQSAEHS